MMAPVRQCAALNTPRSSDCSSFSHESTSSAINVGWYRSINRNSTAGVRLDTITGRGTRNPGVTAQKPDTDAKFQRVNRLTFGNLSDLPGNLDKFVGANSL